MTSSRCPLVLRIIVGWGLLFLLAACAPMGPDYHPPRSDLPARWETGSNRQQPGRTVDLHHWWRLFHDARLDALIDRAMAANPDLAMAAARIREARALCRVAGAALLPSADLNGKYTNTHKSEHVSSSSSTRQDLFQLNFDAAWELDLFGGARRQVEATEATLGAVVEDYRDVLVSLTAEVASNYLALRTAQQRLAVTRNNVHVQEQTLHYTRERHAAGLGDTLDIARAQTQLAMLQAQIPPLQTTEAQARHRLAILLGQHPQAGDPDLNRAAAQPLPPPQLPVLLPSALLRQRPDIRSAERRLAAANAEVGVATADLFPRFSLSALIGLQSSDLPRLVSTGSRYWSLGPGVQWSLLDNGRRRAVLEASEARLDRARLTYEKTVLTALAETEDALVACDREQAVRSRLAQAVDSARQTTALAQGRYTAGLSDFLSLLQAETAQAEAEDKLVQSDQRLSQAMIALCKAMGGGWPMPTAQAISPCSSTVPAENGGP